MNTLRQPTVGPQWVRLAALAVIMAALLVAAWFLIDALQGGVEQAAVQVPALNAPAAVAARSAGMGDVRRFEGQLAQQSRTAGMGDVRRFEGQLAQQSRTAGMGDVRRFEGQLAQQSRPVGMGDVHLVESAQRSE